MKKKWLLAFCSFVPTIVGLANPIDLQTARQIAKQYIASPTAINAPRATIKSTNVHNTCAASKAYYLFNNADGKGFAIIAGDDRLGNVIGYSTTGHLVADSLHAPLQMLLDDYARAAEQLSVDSVNLKPSYSHLPKAYVTPVIGSKWNQTYPWNLYTPIRNGANAPVGCVAAALSQILYYHKWPKDRPNGMIKGNDAQGLDYYDWEAMLPEYSGVYYSSHNASAVATLMRDVGQAVRMNYGTDGSWSDDAKAWYALENMFGYSVRFLEKDVMPGTEYIETIYNELSVGNPVFVVGGDHAFVYEGYDTNGLVYINWGWGGLQDGYYNIDIVSLPPNQYTQGKFYHRQKALLARPKDGKHQIFTEQPIILTMENANGFHVDERTISLDGSLTAGLGRVAAHNMAQGDDYSYTGEVGIGLFNQQGECIHVFKSPFGTIQWTNFYNGQYLNSSAYNPWKLNMNEVKGLLNEGRYFLRPMCHRQLNLQTDEWESWRFMLNGNSLGMTVASNSITLDAPDEHAQLSVEGKPEELVPGYQYGGDLAAFIVNVKNTLAIDAHCHVKLIFKGVDGNAGETYEVPEAYTTGLFLAKNRTTTPWIIKYATSYSTSTSSGMMRAGYYTPIIEVTYPDGDNYFEDEVTDTIKTTLAFPDFRVTVNPSGYQGAISIPSLTLYNGSNVLETKIVDPQDVSQLGVSINTRVSSMRADEITLPMRYRFVCITDKTKSYTTSAINLTMRYGLTDLTSASRCQIPVSALAANNTYEIHVEMLRDGQWIDYWNTDTPRRQFTISTSNPVRNAKNVVGGFLSTDFAKLQALYDMYATMPSSENFSNLTQAMEQTPRLDAAPMQAYRLRNKYTDNSTLYLSANGTQLRGQNASNDVSQLFALVPGRVAGTWRIYSLASKKYVGKLPPYGTEVELTEDINEAADYRINVSSSNYTVSLIAANPSDASYSALHLGKRNRIEPWSATDESAFWYMECVEGKFVDSYAFHFIEQCDYQTTYLPYPFVVPEGMKAGYICGTTSNGKLQVAFPYAAGAIVPALTPVILQGEASTSYACTLLPENNPSSSQVSHNLLHGTLTDAPTYAEGDNYYYKMAFGTGASTSLGFYWSAENGAPFINKAYKAFLALPKTMAAQQRSFILGDAELTGINVPIMSPTGKPLNIYDLQGRRLQQLPVKGIVITSEGRKMVR